MKLFACESNFSPHTTQILSLIYALIIDSMHDYALSPIESHTMPFNMSFLFLPTYNQGCSIWLGHITDHFPLPTFIHC